MKQYLCFITGSNGTIYKKRSFGNVLLVAMCVLWLAGCSDKTTTQTAGKISPAIPDSAADEDQRNTPKSDSVSAPQEDPSILSHNNGKISTEDGFIVYDVITRQQEDLKYVIDLTFYDDASNELLQQISYPLRDDFKLETVENEARAVNINQINGKAPVPALILDLGSYEETKHAACYVYNSGQKEFVLVEYFDDLPAPVYDNGDIYEHWKGDEVYTLKKLWLDGKELYLTAMLDIDYSGPAPLYTEAFALMGTAELLTLKEKVPEEEVHIDKWGTQWHVVQDNIARAENSQDTSSDSNYKDQENPSWAKATEKYGILYEHLNLDGVGEADDTIFTSTLRWGSQCEVTRVSVKLGTGEIFSKLYEGYYFPSILTGPLQSNSRDTIVLELLYRGSNYLGTQVHFLEVIPAYKDDLHESLFLTDEFSSEPSPATKSTDHLLTSGVEIVDTEGSNLKALRVPLLNPNDRGNNLHVTVKWLNNEWVMGNPE
ncbi:hypothetical protein HNQ56_002916 [Anaerotaenia torta]|uniref:hypothetical protein n=1 Tax=Anaerotaenia torta TaxID=433293 RepID=UPI003D1FAF99